MSGRNGTRILEEAFSSQPTRSWRVGSAYDDDLVWEGGVLAFGLEGDPGDRSDRLLDLRLPFEIERLG